MGKALTPMHTMIHQRPGQHIYVLSKVDAVVEATFQQSLAFVLDLKVLVFHTRLLRCQAGIDTKTKISFSGLQLHDLAGDKPVADRRRKWHIRVFGDDQPLLHGPLDALRDCPFKGRKRPCAVRGVIYRQGGSIFAAIRRVDLDDLLFVVCEGRGCEESLAVAAFGVFEEKCKEYLDDGGHLRFVELSVPKSAVA